MSDHLVLVAGNIGSGKTTLTKLIGQRLGWTTGFETVADNPYLGQFYGDMAAWSFHLQIYFLGDRARLHQELASTTGSAIADRSIYEDAFIFARALHELGNLSDRDLHAYRSIFDLVVGGLPKPDLLLYLQAPVDVLMERIRQRGREMEGGITADYLSLLDNYYNEWLAEFDACPVLTIPTNDLNYVQIEEHTQLVLDRIQDRLAGKEDLIFPSSP